MTKVREILRRNSSGMNSMLASAVSKHGPSGLQSVLGVVPYRIYQARHFSEAAKRPDDLVYFTKINDVLDDVLTSQTRRRILEYPYDLDLRNPKVTKVSKQDVLSNKSENGQIIIASQDDIEIRYGDKGIAPSAKNRLSDLLKYSLTIPAKSYGIIDASNQVPFLIEARDPDNTFMIVMSELEEVCEHEENIKRYSMNPLLEMKSDDAVRFTLDLKRKIFHDPRKEDFFEETTSPVYPPTIHNKSSGTLMDFTSEDDGDRSTAMHFHPGERSLHIFTTGKKSGVTLNFCGTSENPDERQDCSVFIPFPKNSYIVLNFPSYTHHKFHGDFVCLSVHPREGKGIIEAVQSKKTLDDGFLKFATVVSSTDKMHEQWSLSANSSVSENHDISESQDKSK